MNYPDQLACTDLGHRRSVAVADLLQVDLIEQSLLNQNSTVFLTALRNPCAVVRTGLQEIHAVGVARLKNLGTVPLIELSYQNLIADSDLNKIGGMLIADLGNPSEIEFTDR